MGEKKKITVFRVFQAAQCGSAKYVLGVLCSAVSILCTAVPFYTVYRIVRIFLAVSYTHLLSNTERDQRGQTDSTAGVQR